jgi:hypothetical protein
MTATVGARNLFKVDAGVVHALMHAWYRVGNSSQRAPVFLGDGGWQFLSRNRDANLTTFLRSEH